MKDFLLEEEWLLFEGRDFHHRETFSYEYDSSGRKSRGRFENSARGVSYAISYTYDECGRGTGELWVNEAQPADRYTLTYEYDAQGRLSGGEGVGALHWTYRYSYDDSGRQVALRNQYTNGPSWTFLYSYDDTGRRVLGEGTATSGRSAIITYKYQGGHEATSGGSISPEHSQPLPSGKKESR